MKNLFTPTFWFNQRPGDLTPLFKNSLLVIIIFLIAAAIFSFLAKKNGGIYARLWEKIFNFSSTNVVIGIALFFFNQELIPMLSSRFWFILWLIGAAIWIVFIIRHILSIPEKKKDFEKQREFQKYIPK